MAVRTVHRIPVQVDTDQRSARISPRHGGPPDGCWHLPAD